MFNLKFVRLLLSQLSTSEGPGSFTTGVGLLVTLSGSRGFSTGGLLGATLSWRSSLSTSEGSGRLLGTVLSRRFSGGTLLTTLFKSRGTGRLLGTALSRRFTTSAVSHRYFTVSYIIAGTDNEEHTETYASSKNFQKSFSGFRFTNPKTGLTFNPEDLQEQHIDPTVVYIAKHPFFKARMEDYSHSQISDNAFEDKACAALERHLQPRLIHRRIPHNPSKREDAWRILTDESDKGKDVAEWEGIWESEDGHVFFLEAKHYMTLVSFCRFYISVLVYIYKG